MNETTIEEQPYDSNRVYALDEITPETVSWLADHPNHGINVRTRRGTVKRVCRGIETHIDYATGDRSHIPIWYAMSMRTFAASDLTLELMRVFDPEAYDRGKRRKEKAAAMRKEAEDQAAESLKVGDILYSSWGYEQTNIDFFEVVAKRGQMVTLRPIAQEEAEETGSLCGIVVPIKGKYLDRCAIIDDEPSATRKVRGSAEHPYVVLNSVANAWVWDGRPMRCSSYY